MLNISGINDINNIIYNYKKQIEEYEYELVYKCIVDHLTPCIPTKNFNNLSLDELLDTFTTKIRPMDLDMIGLCRNIINDYNSDILYKNDLIYFKKYYYIKSYGDIKRITSKRKLTLEEYALLWIIPKEDQPLERFEKHLKR